MCCILELKSSFDVMTCVDTGQIHSQVKHLRFAFTWNGWGTANAGQRHEQNQVGGSHDLLISQLKVILKRRPRSAFFRLQNLESVWKLVSVICDL